MPSNKKPRSSKAATATKEKVPEPQPLYVLVHYTEEKTVGVVATTEVDSSVGVGGRCSAPNPIDWDERDGSLTPAKIVAFGHNINFLYNLSVDEEEGKLIQNFNADLHKAATKKSKEVQERRSVNVNAINNAAANTPSLFENNETQNLSVTPQNTPSTCILKQLIETGSVQNKNELRSSLELVYSHLSAPVSNNEHGRQESQEFASSDFVGEVMAAACQVLMSAEPHKCSYAAQTVPQFQHHATASAPTPFVYFGDVKKIHEKRIDVDLPCYHNGTDKVHLVENGPIFIDKLAKANLPWVTPRENDAPSRNKKPKITGAVYPKELVSILLKQLVPWDILQDAKGTTLPLKLFNTIKAYINMRLPYSRKVLESDMNEYVTENIREMKRSLLPKVPKIPKIPKK